MAIDFETRRFTVEEYERMGDAGILHPDERTELLDGIVIAVPPSGEAHGGSINRAVHTLVRRFDGRAVVQPQLPVKTAVDSLPEPDLALLRWDSRFYADRRVVSQDVLALIEVSASRLSYDRGPKLRNYARARVPEYWIVNLLEDIVEIYRNPTDVNYAEHSILHRGEQAAFAAFPSDPLAAEDFLP